MLFRDFTTISYVIMHLLPNLKDFCFAISPRPTTPHGIVFWKYANITWRQITISGEGLPDCQCDMVQCHYNGRHADSILRYLSAMTWDYLVALIRNGKPINLLKNTFHSCITTLYFTMQSLAYRSTI